MLGHCHPFHIVADLAAGLVETLGVSDDKEITLLTDGKIVDQMLLKPCRTLTIVFYFPSSALVVSGATKTGRDEMMDEVIAASQLQQILLATTQDAAIV